MLGEPRRMKRRARRFRPRTATVRPRTPGGPAPPSSPNRAIRAASSFRGRCRERRLNFSFSGLKTACSPASRALGAIDDNTRSDLAASFQAAIVEVLVAKCELAMEREALSSASWWRAARRQCRASRPPRGTRCCSRSAGLLSAAAPVHRQRRDDRFRRGAQISAGAHGWSAELSGISALGPRRSGARALIRSGLR